MAKIDTCYFIHHSHTDIGYTHDQPIVWDLHERFIDAAIDCAERSVDTDDDAAFRWTVETTRVLEQWLAHAPPARIDRFLALERAGRIEVTGMLANVTPLYDTDQLIESLQPVRRLREEYGLTIRHAMNCDVNGQNWPLVDLLLDAGIEGLTMAINTHFGGAPFQRPNAFHWEGPSGRTLLAWNGWPYPAGWRFGIGHDPDLLEQTWWPRVQRRLNETDYPLSCLMVQSIHPFGDNGSALAGFSDFIAAWNAAGKRPRLVFATPAMWWTAVRTEADRLPTYRGDWTDYWNFGCISSAREQTVNRASRVRLRTADALTAITQHATATADPNLARSYSRYRDAAWTNLNFWDEHTWGADQSIRQPEIEDTATQWHHKAGYAYAARSQSLLLQRDGLAALAKRIDGRDEERFLLFNPLPWPVRIAGDVTPGLLSDRISAADGTASRHFQDRMHDADNLALVTDRQAKLDHSAAIPELFTVGPVDVPAFGYATIGVSEFVRLNDAVTIEQTNTVENHRHRLVFDRERGGIRAWQDKLLDHDWVDTGAGRSLHSFVYETVADRTHPAPRKLQFDVEWESDHVERPDGWRPDWPVERLPATRVVSHRVYRTPLGTHMVQHVEAPGCASLLRQSVFLPHDADYVECSASWQMGLETHPEATYLLFPFNLAQATARFDLGGQAVIADEEQLPGVCRDYFTVQQWVDFNDGRLGMTVATPDNPMIQLGDFHFGQHQMKLEPERAMLLGWVTNNYWETNFRAHQPGEVRARYRLQPYAGPFDEARAHRFGLETAYGQPVLQRLGEPKPDGPLLPESGSLLSLPGSNGCSSPVLTLHVKPDRERNGIVVRLLNASDTEQTAQLGSGHLRITAAQRCSLLEEPLHELAVQDEAVGLTLAAREIAVIRLEVRFGNERSAGPEPW